MGISFSTPGEAAPFSSAAAKRVFPKATVIQNFQTGHGWTKATLGALVDDTTDWVKGTQCVKLTTDGASGACVCKKTGLTAINFTGRQPIVWIKVNDQSRVWELSLYLSSDNLTSHFYIFDIKTNQLDSGKWIPLVLSFTNATVTGTPNRAAINSIQFRAKDNGSSLPFDLKIGGIGSVAEASAGVCSITFDDNWASAYDVARPIMDAYNFAGTMYTIPDAVGTTNYMTLAQLKKLQDEAGWDVAGHHQTNLTTLQNPDYAVRSVKKWLGENGFHKGLSEFAYPNGAYNDDVIAAVKRHFRSGRSIIEKAEVPMPADLMRLKVLQCYNTVAPATIAAAVTAALTNKDWLILVFHKIVTTATVSTEYSTANFTTVIGDIATQGIAVKPVSEVLNGL
jgi:peptidoglycan/xylan/chitin deacetylase (PgdA/CDA1 family)